jgi:alkyldihydroxyacetonephosphate synthase
VSTPDDTATLSAKPARRFWGWGYLRDGLTAGELRAVHQLLASLGPMGPALPEPRVADYTLAPPRGALPDSLAATVSSTPYDRLTHCYGKGFPDVARMWMRHVPHAPDWVAFPRTEADIADALDWASFNDVAVVPFGGGTSVVGGVEAAVGPDYGATLSLDLEYFNQVLEVDTASRAALIQAGMLGPDLEAALRPHGLTLRHFPQSFEFSTLGGWIATRAGGHYATQYTHIDDFVQSTRMITPAGVVETRRLPGSGAGPAPDRLVIGSEGTMGVITQAWMRLQDRPVFRASASVAFDDVFVAARCVRALSQSGLQPSNCRLLDAREVAFAGVGDRRSPTLVLGFESADHPLDAWMARALELVADHGGRWDAQAVADSMRAADAQPPAHRSGAAGDWRNAFIRMPYWRDETTRLGAIFDTFESAITWDRFEAFYEGVRQDVETAIERVTGHASRLSCRFTHVYPDGPAPYFTFTARGSSSGDIASALARWRDIKLACNDAVVRHGGTSTHHHAVGRDHRKAYETEVPPLMRQALAGAKAVFDPRGVMNPGALFDPVGRPVGIRGVLEPSAP